MSNWHKVFKPKWLIEVLKNVPESLSAWIVLQNKVFINQEQSVFSKTRFTKGPCRHVFFFKATLIKKNTLHKTCVLFPNAHIWSYKRLYNKPVARSFEKDCS